MDEAVTRPAAWWAEHAGLTRMDAILATRCLTGWMAEAMEGFGPMPAEAAA